MGESIWIILTISMTILAAGLAAYLAYYKKNIQSINNELEMILREDTNYLLTSSSNAAELKQHVLILNESLSSIKEVKKKMVRTNKSFRESIAGVSHDLRTPLTSAGGYIQMLQNEKLDLEQRKEYTKIVRDRIQTVGELLDQLFAYARMEADELELDLEPVNLSNILFDTLSLYYKDFTARNEEPEITVPDRVCFIKGHFDSVKRVITNIIYNALIHGDGNYKFQLKEEAQTIVLLCSNKTNSIRQEDVEYLFDRFYTTDKSRNRKTNGLGLAVAKRLTELMGGTIGAELIGEELCIHVIFIKQ